MESNLVLILILIMAAMDTLTARAAN